VDKHWVESYQFPQRSKLLQLNYQLYEGQHILLYIIHQRIGFSAGFYGKEFNDITRANLDGVSHTGVGFARAKLYFA
jgi:hypothetical protein